MGLSFASKWLDFTIFAFWYSVGYLVWNESALVCSHLRYMLKRTTYIYIHKDVSTVSTCPPFKRCVYCSFDYMANSCRSKRCCNLLDQAPKGSTSWVEALLNHQETFLFACHNYSVMTLMISLMTLIVLDLDMHVQSSSTINLYIFGVADLRWWQVNPWLCID